MSVQTQKVNQDQTSVQTQSTTQCPWRGKYICLEFLREVLTCCDLVHYYDFASTFNNQRMEYTPGIIRPGLSSGQHRVWHVYGDSPRYINQGRNQEDTRPQAPQEPLWEKSRV